MRDSIEKISHNLRQVPMLCALPLLMAGIIVGEWFDMPTWCAAGLFLAFVIAEILWSRNALFVAVVITAGILAATLRATPALPARSEMEIEIKRIVSTTSQRTTAEGSVRAFNASDRLLRSHAQVRLTLEGISVEQGDRLLAIASSHPLSTTDNYHRYMAAQGFAAQIYLKPDDILRQSPSPKGIIGTLQQYASQRIAQLGLDAEAESIARTIAIGDRGAITPTLRQAYTLSGGAHLLAVSGLHVGFLFLLLNLLLLPLTLLGGGQVARGVITVVAVWLYAAVAGLSPSVVRAATMFTVLQLSTMTYSTSRALNSLALAAFIMLVVDARTLHDAGFQLSFLSVAAILLWASPYIGYRGREEYRHSLWHEIPRKIVSRLHAAAMVSIAATVATQPLVSHLFGTMSLWSILLSPILVPLCGVAMGATILWILMPIPFMQGIAHWVIESAIDAMNALSQWAAANGGLTLEASISGQWTLLIYGVFALLTLLHWAYRTKNRPTAKLGGEDI